MRLNIYTTLRRLDRLKRTRSTPHGCERSTRAGGASPAPGTNQYCRRAPLQLTALHASSAPRHGLLLDEHSSRTVSFLYVSRHKGAYGWILRVKKETVVYLILIKQLVKWFCDE